MKSARRLLGILITAAVIAACAPFAGAQSPPGTADVRLTVYVVHGTDEGRGDKFDEETAKLEAALDKVNRRYFRMLKEIRGPVVFGDTSVFPLMADRLFVTIEPKTDNRYPVEVEWKKGDGTNHVKMKVRLAPKKLFAIQGTPYKDGNLWAVLKIDEGTFSLHEEKGPSGSAPVPPLRDPVKPGEESR